MRLLVALAALAVTPLAAVAQDASTERPEPESEALWSLGAGVTTQVIYVSSASGFLTANGPGFTASAERRLSGGTWLALGGIGAFSRERNDVPADWNGLSEAESQQLQVSAGIRQVVTAARAPVDFSVLVTADAGFSSAEETYIVDAQRTEEVHVHEHWTLGASVGIAVDRELARGIALRLATPIAGVSFGKGRTEWPGQPTRSSTDLFVRAALAPRIELRLTF
jgi:hypothetical protein